MLGVAALLALVPAVWRGLTALSGRLTAAYAGIGILVALHWVTFYAAIKLANASVAASCLALCPIFLAILEPWIARRPHSRHELWLGVAVVPGVVLLVGGTPQAMNAGIAVGIVSAFIVAVFGACNKRLVERADPLTVTWLEMAAGTAFLTLAVPVFAAAPAFVLPGPADAAYLAVLVLACTLLPFVLSLVALKHLTAFGAQLAVNLEPVYAILLAMLLFGEQRELDLAFYAGVAVVIGAVFIHPLISHR